jgi:hypothetical protein
MALAEVASQQSWDPKRQLQLLVRSREVVCSRHAYLGATLCFTQRCSTAQVCCARPV